jgi:hypothetical protein
MAEFEAADDESANNLDERPQMIEIGTDRTYAYQSTRNAKETDWKQDPTVW